MKIIADKILIITSSESENRFVDNHIDSCLPFQITLFDMLLPIILFITLDS